MNQLKQRLLAKASVFLVLLCAMFTACNEAPVKEQVTQEEQPVDTTRVKTVDQDSIEIDEAAVPYVSLLDQRNQVANEAIIAALIEEGAKNVLYTSSNSVLSSLHPSPPVAYDKVSFFVYLEDLLRFAQYETQAGEVQMSEPKKIIWPGYSGLPEPNHEALAYPLVRKDYLSEYCPGCLNPAFVALNGKEVDPTQVSHPRYQPLLELYTQIFDPQIRQALYRDYIAFAYEELGTQKTNLNAQSRATAALASQFNQRAQAEVNSEKQQQASRMQQYFTSLKQAWKSKDERAMDRYLNEILQLQESLLEPLPIQDDIVRFFTSENKGNPLSKAIKTKAGQLKSYRPLAVSSDERVLSVTAMSFAQKALQATPLNPEELQKIRTTLNGARDRVTNYTRENAATTEQLAVYTTVFTDEERTFFNAYLLSFQYHINIWKRFQLQLEELLDVPPEENSFSYLLLLDHAVKEREKALASNPLIATAHSKLRKLAGIYYRELREKEAIFKQHE